MDPSPFALNRLIICPHTMCFGRLEEAEGISLRHGAAIVARVVLGDNISENTERTDRFGIMLTTDRFVYSQQSDERM